MRRQFRNKGEIAVCEETTVGSALYDPLFDEEALFEGDEDKDHHEMQHADNGKHNQQRAGGYALGVRQQQRQKQKEKLDDEINAQHTENDLSLLLICKEASVFLRKFRTDHGYGSEQHRSIKTDEVFEPKQHE